MTEELLILCLTVFFGRICDVAIGSIRTIFLVDGKKVKAAIAGFVEVFIWFNIVREAMSSDVGGIYVALAYAGGFALGNYVGGWISEKILGEMQTVHVITTRLCMAEELRKCGFAVTEMDCKGMNDQEKKFLFVQIQSKQSNKLEKTINELDNHAFITVNKTKAVVNGYLKKQK